MAFCMLYTCFMYIQCFAKWDNFQFAVTAVIHSKHLTYSFTEE